MTAASKKSQTESTRDFADLNEREQKFCLYMLGSHKPAWSAGRAGYSGDLQKRARGLMQRPPIIAILKKYAPPQSDGTVELSRDGLLRKLAQIASGQLVKISTNDVLKAIELIGKSLGMWEGASQDGKDRLKELIDAFNAGPVPKQEAKQ